MHRSIRRLAALAIVAIPIWLVGGAGATWGAAPATVAPPRAPHAFDLSALAQDRDGEERTESAVVLVVLDGVRWQEVFGGADRALAHQRGMNPLTWANPRDLMPNLQNLLEARGMAIGAPGHGPELVASGPQFISFPGYLEIFAGHPDTSCASNDCARSPAHTIADDVRDESGPDDVAVITSWPAIARAASTDASRFVLSAGRKLLGRSASLRADDETTSLLERGAGARSYPGEGEYRPDPFTAAVALRVLRTVRPRFLFVGLGDADEYAHRNDYRSYLEAVHASDVFLGDLFTTLEGMGARGRHTTVLLTADHGRAYGFRDHGARYPESGRVFLAALGGDVRGRGLVAASRRHTLSDVAPTVRALLGIAGDGDAIPEIVRPLRAP